MKRIRVVLLPVLAAMALGAAACGRQNSSASEDGAAGSEHGAHGPESASFGEPGAESEADRTVEVTAADPYRFDPDQIEVKAGETITFLISNEGKQDHEFVLGDEAYQEEHEADMAESDMDMGSEENGVEVAPGATERITWTFAESGTVLYACHEPGHYEGGMVGTISLGS